MTRDAELKGANRRRSPRVQAAHELVLHCGDGTSIAATSVDLNLGGIYCTLSRHQPLFTKLQIGMSLTIRGEDDERRAFELALDAVVVRMEPEEPTPGCEDYACAMAFVNVSPEAELLLAKYLLQSIGEAD